MLQRLLPEETRSIIITRLLEKYLKVDETTFCNDLYMSENDVKSLLSEDMFLGSHTYNHFWLNSLTY